LELAKPTVAAVTSTRRQRRPPAPFTTSTLQQEAARRLGFTARRTMQIAQQLYEGIDVGEEGPVGLITYMRTDSVNVAQEAQEAARRFIAQHYGAELVPARPNVYKSRKGAQEAHEAIRPTSVERTPESVRPYLKPDQWRLYELVWRRFVASQMAPALVEQTTVTIRAGRLELRATGSVTLAPGFTLLWGPERRRSAGSAEAGGAALRSEGGREAEEGADADEEEGHQPLPPLQEGQALQLLQAIPEQHFTQPPPRFNDASLVKTMEELGIGRPSTYAPTIETLLERRYVRREGARLVPTPLGRAVVKLLKEQFPDVVDVEFTAQMEAQLDAVEAGQVHWQDVVARFYHPFEQRVQEAMRSLERVTIQEEPSGETCERCGRPMVIKWGRFGRFLACSGYPECRNTRPLLQKTGARCPVCGGDLVERRTRRGRTFYGCANYPRCTYTLWHRPVGRACPVCGRPLVYRGGRGAQQVVCAGTLEKGDDGRPRCDYVEARVPAAAPDGPVAAPDGPAAAGGAPPEGGLPAAGEEAHSLHEQA
ncbi:MAG TPA: DNA topoisomerase, partial [Limnochordales bacterium]